MFIKKKLRDVTKEEFTKWRSIKCANQSCKTCIFNHVQCASTSWVNNKDLFSNKFLNQKIEIETPDVLDDVEKEYLSSAIKPFRNRVINITKKSYANEFNYISICLKTDAVNFRDYSNLPIFRKDTMYKNMELDKSYTLKELGLFKKIKLSEFWSLEEKLAIHCDTEEKANKLLKKFDELGKKWSSGKSYLKENYWDCYKKETCYSNQQSYASYQWDKNNGYTIYEFEDVDLNN